MRTLIISLGWLLSAPVVAQTEQDIFEEMAVECVSHLVITAIATETKLSKMVFRRDGKWWRTMLVNLTNEKEADQRIALATKNLQKRWNEDKIAYEKLLSTSKMCSETKLEIESGQNAQ